MKMMARSGEVRCRVLMDRLGSIAAWWTAPPSPMPEGFKPPSSMPHYLREGSRVQVRASQNPWLVADHSKLLETANRRFAAALLDRGGKVYRYPTFSHVKAILVDDWVCLGSANLDGLGMRINSELNILTKAPDGEFGFVLIRALEPCEGTDEKSK